MLLNEAGTDTFLFLSFVVKQTKCFLDAQKIRKLLSNHWKSHLKRNLTKVQEKISKPVLNCKAEVKGVGQGASLLMQTQGIAWILGCHVTPQTFVKIKDLRKLKMHLNPI